MGRKHRIGPKNKSFSFSGPTFHKTDYKISTTLFLDFLRASCRFQSFVLCKGKTSIQIKNQTKPISNFNENLNNMDLGLVEVPGIGCCSRNFSISIIDFSRQNKFINLGLIQVSVDLFNFNLLITYALSLLKSLDTH